MFVEISGVYLSLKSSSFRIGLIVFGIPLKIIEWNSYLLDPKYFSIETLIFWMRILILVFSFSKVLNSVEDYSMNSKILNDIYVQSARETKHIHKKM